MINGYFSCRTNLLHRPLTLATLLSSSWSLSTIYQFPSISSIACNSLQFLSCGIPFLWVKTHDSFPHHSHSVCIFQFTSLFSNNLGKSKVSRSSTTCAPDWSQLPVSSVLHRWLEQFTGQVIAWFCYCFSQ